MVTYTIEASDARVLPNGPEIRSRALERTGQYGSRHTRCHQDHTYRGKPPLHFIGDAENLYIRQAIETLPQQNSAQVHQICSVLRLGERDLSASCCAGPRITTENAAWICLLFRISAGRLVSMRSPGRP